MERLSIGAENLLREIIDHRNENNIPDSDYWKTKYVKMDMNAKAVIGSQFKELEDQNMISIQWADDHPYWMQILNNGWAYEADRNREEEQKKADNRNEFWRTLIVGIICAIVGVLIGKIF